LAKHEVPVYLALPKTPDETDALAMLEDYPEPIRLSFTVELLQSHAAFQALLKEQRVLAPERPGFAQYQNERQSFDRLWEQGVFTRRHAQQAGDLSLRRMFSACFLRQAFVWQ